MKRPIVCVIPAFNADATLGAVVRGVRRAIPDVAIVCVDDGSTDTTRVVARACCDETIVLDRNHGKGFALRIGFAAALGYEPDVVMTIDADGQHDPAFAPSLVDATAEADIVVGARDLRGVAIPLHRRFANLLSTAAASVVTKHTLRDSQSGFRAVRAAVLHQVRARGDRYEFETDFLVRAALAGYRIAEVPISAIYGAPSHFREIRDSLRVTRVLASHWGALFR